MFELVSADRRRIPHRGSIPLLMSTTAHLIGVGVLVAVPFLYVSAELPHVPDMLTFVVPAAPALPPPPPPPPPAAASTPAPRPNAVNPVRATSRPAPLVAPVAISQEAELLDVGGEEGVPGGIEGGVPGGVIGGVIGGLIPTDVLAPPPPPPATAVVERGPVRVGGAITAPALVERVEPEYPPVAVSARVQGVVILEATVGRDGHVEDVRVLRSLPLLDRAAMNAVRQWRYSPLLLNGTAERFVVSVTVSFSIGDTVGRR